MIDGDTSGYQGDECTQITHDDGHTKGGLVPFDSRRYRDALVTLLTLDAPPDQDRDTWSLMSKASDHLKELLWDQLSQNLKEAGEYAKAAARLPLPCWVDDQPCEVFDTVRDHLPEFWSHLSRGWYQREMFDWFMPCCWCRGAERVAQRIRGRRLGRVERQLLLAATPPGQGYNRGGVNVLPKNPTPSEKVAVIRARQKLFRMGLVWKRANHTERRVRRKTDYAAFTMTGSNLALRLSPVGEEIVSRYRDELEGGKPIRWDRRVEEAVQAARKRGTDLLRLLAANIGLYFRSDNPWFLSANAKYLQDVSSALGSTVIGASGIGLLLAIQKVAPGAEQEAATHLDDEKRQLLTTVMEVMGRLPAPS